MGSSGPSPRRQCSLVHPSATQNIDSSSATSWTHLLNTYPVMDNSPRCGAPRRKHTVPKFSFSSNKSGLYNDYVMLYSRGSQQVDRDMSSSRLQLPFIFFFKFFTRKRIHFISLFDPRI
jgi:hypothetical protein